MSAPAMLRREENRRRPRLLTIGSETEKFGSYSSQKVCICANSVVKFALGLYFCPSKQRIAVGSVRHPPHPRSPHWVGGAIKKKAAVHPTFKPCCPLVGRTAYLRLACLWRVLPRLALWALPPDI
ncbi:MAG: hypothetical protein AAFS07_06140 [Pseudomonadota bacterium]